MAENTQHTHEKGATMGDMDNRICYYANKSFFDRDSKSYFVAKVTENEAGYTQTSWAYKEPRQAQEEADRLNATSAGRVTTCSTSSAAPCGRVR